MSRVRKFELPRGPEGGFGITLRGDCPVFIRSVDFHSPARAAGMKSGDLLLEVNGDSVRYSTLKILGGARYAPEYYYTILLFANQNPR